MNKNALTSERHWRIAIGSLVLLLVLGSSVWSVVSANNLVACHRQSIHTLYERDKYTDELRSLTDRDGNNLDELIAAITADDATRESVETAFDKYNQQAQEIDEQRKNIRQSQDDFTYPKIESCE